MKNWHAGSEIELSITTETKVEMVTCGQQLLELYNNEAEKFLLLLVTVNKT